MVQTRPLLYDDYLNLLRMYFVDVVQIQKCLVRESIALHRSNRLTMFS